MESQSQSQSQRLPRSSLPAADLTAEMETMAQRHVSMDDSFHLPNFPHMAWVDPSALPAIVIMPSLRARFECITSSLITLSSLQHGVLMRVKTAQQINDEGTVGTSKVT